MFIYLQLVSFCLRLLFFSFLLCGLASLDSNLPLCFVFAFSLSAFLLLRFWPFASSLLLSCAYQKTISLQVGRKLADKTKDEIMTEVLWVFASLDDKLRLSRLRTRSVSPSPLQSPFGRPNRFRESIRFLVLYLGEWPPYYARARFRFSFRGR